MWWFEDPTNARESEATKKDSGGQWYATASCQSHSRLYFYLKIHKYTEAQETCGPLASMAAQKPTQNSAIHKASEFDGTSTKTVWQCYTPCTNANAFTQNAT